jgi:ribosomal protein L2
MTKRALKPIADDAPFKTYRPITPSLRHVRLPNNPHLWKGRAYEPLTYAYRSTGGRNNQGRVTVRGRGGGHKRRIRILDLTRKDWPKEGGEVERIERDPGRGGHIALVRLLRPSRDGEEPKKDMRYILATLGMRAGDKVNAHLNAKPATDDPEDLENIELQRIRIAEGNTLPLGSIPVGTIINSISTRVNGPASLCRAAGTKAVVIGQGAKGIQVSFACTTFDYNWPSTEHDHFQGPTSVEGDPIFESKMCSDYWERVESASQWTAGG